jgi:hypothetical protein
LRSINLQWKKYVKFPLIMLDLSMNQFMVDLDL